MNFVILLNGPPGSGKDTAAEILTQKMAAEKLKATMNTPGADVMKRKFSDPVKIGTHASYGIFDTGKDDYELLKDNSLPEFLGLTPRQAYIKHSEEYMKPIHGQDVYGRIACNMIEKDEISIFADSGFMAEALPLTPTVGHQNVVQVRIFRDGCDFSNDSRSYWYAPEIQQVDVLNNGSILQLEDQLLSTIERAMKCKQNSTKSKRFGLSAISSTLTKWSPWSSMQSSRT